MDHGTITQNGQVEAIAVKSHELRAQFGDLFTERADQLFFSALADVGGTQGVHRPMIALAVSDKRADAHNSMVDVLRKLVAEGLSNVRIRLTDKVICRSKPTQIGHSF